MKTGGTWGSSYGIQGKEQLPASIWREKNQVNSWYSGLNILVVGVVFYMVGCVCFLVENEARKIKQESSGLSWRAVKREKVMRSMDDAPGDNNWKLDQEGSESHCGHHRSWCILCVFETETLINNLFWRAVITFLRCSSKIPSLWPVPELLQEPRTLQADRCFWGGRNGYKSSLNERFFFCFAWFLFAWVFFFSFPQSVIFWKKL